MAIPQGPKHRWSVAFVHDLLADGRRLRILAVMNDFTRECLALVVDTSISGARVVRELEKLAELRGGPCMVASGNRGELTSNTVLAWSEETGIEWHNIALSKAKTPSIRPLKATRPGGRVAGSRCKTPSSSRATNGFAVDA